MKPLSKDLRQRIIDAYLKRKESLREIARRFSVSLSTVWHLVEQFRDTGSLAPKPHRGGPVAKLEVSHYFIINDIVGRKPDVTLAELGKLLQKATGTEVSPATLGKALHRLGLTRKKRAFQASERQQDPEVEQARAEFREEQPQVPVEQAQFVDEAGVDLGMARIYGWAPSNARVIGYKPLHPGPRFNLIGALGLHGVTAILMVQGTVNGEVFKAFVEQCLAPTLQAGDIVYVDNVSFHKVAGIREAVEKQGATLKYLPAYSPDYSPIELFWSKFKGSLRNAAARTVNDLQEAIKKAINEITENDIRGWFKHCGYCIEPS